MAAKKIKPRSELQKEFDRLGDRVQDRLVAGLEAFDKRLDSHRRAINDAVVGVRSDLNAVIDRVTAAEKALLAGQSSPKPLRRIGQVVGRKEVRPGETFLYVNRYTDNEYVCLEDGSTLCVRGQDAGRRYMNNSSGPCRILDPDKYGTRGGPKRDLW